MQIDAPRNHKELMVAIHQLKNRINEKEERLAAAWRQLPMETLKAAVGAIVPGLLQSRMAAGVFTILKSVWSLFFSAKKEGMGADWKRDLLGGVKQLGLFSLIGMVFRLFMGKNKDSGG